MHWRGSAQRMGQRQAGSPTWWPVFQDGKHVRFRTRGPDPSDVPEQNVAESGGSLQVSHDIESAYAGADVVYAKSWGALPFFGNWEPEKPIRDRYKHFIVDEAKMALTNDGVFSHCLPLRRNVKATDAVMDSPRCVAIDEAENRLHVQKAIMAALIQQ